MQAGNSELWRQAPDSFDLREGGVDVWRVQLEQAPDLIPRLLELLSISEIERAERLRSELNRQRFIVAHAALRVVLSRYLNTKADEIQFVVGEHGKPSLAETQSGIHFNLSHSGPLALVAVSRSYPVGVDLEQERGLDNIEGLSERILSPSEREELAELDSANLLRRWTAKEAAVKALGRGVAFGLNSFSISRSQEGLLQLAGTQPEIAALQLRELAVADDYFAAAAMCGPIASIRCFEFKF